MDQNSWFQWFPGDLAATMEVEGKFVDECSSRDQSLCGVAIKLDCNSGMKLKIAVGKMTPIEGNTVRSEDSIVYVKFVVFDI